MSEFHTIPFYIGHEDARRHGNVDEEILDHAEDFGYDTITTRITNDNFQPRVLSYLSEYLRDVEPLPGSPLHLPPSPPIKLPALSAADTTLSPSNVSPRLLHTASTWIDLASSDSVISSISAQVLELEVSYAAFCGASNVLIRGPSPRSSQAGLAQYGRAIKSALKSGPAINFHVIMPMTCEADWDAAADLGDLASFARHDESPEKNNAEPGVRPDSLGSWDTWDLVRSICSYDSRLSIALILPRHLPTVETQTRWLSEPIRILNILKSTFTTNKFATPVLTTAHRAFISGCLRLKTTPWFLLSALGSLPNDDPTTTTATTNGITTPSAPLINNTPPHHGSLSPLSMHPTPSESAHYHPQTNYTTYATHPSQNATAHLNYLRSQIQPRQPPLTPLELYGTGYQDFPQSPLQPLTDNLESVTYEVFEKDPVKYAQYESAIAAALRDWSRSGKLGSAPDGRVVVAVVGAGRGPLVERVIRAGKTMGVGVDVWAVEKNPSAFVHLQRRNENEWFSAVHLVRSDMRSWRGPSYASNQAVAGASNGTAEGSQPSVPATCTSADTYALIDIVVSELLGSFGDNELSPECLDGLAHLLVSGHSVSIPTSYSAHLTPISAPKLWSDIRARPKTASGADATSLPYVAWLHAIDYLSTSSSGPAVQNPTLNIDQTPAPSTSLLFGVPEPIVKETWSFCHPLPPNHILPSNKHNERFKYLRFPTPRRGICHGIAGYFECVLYTSSPPPSTTSGSHPFSTTPQTNVTTTSNTNFASPGPATSTKKPIELSTHPLTQPAKSRDMISWFPIFFPLKSPLMVVEGGEMGISMWRMTDGRKVWYEWCMDVYGQEEQGMDGRKARRQKVASSGLSSCEAEGCLM